MSQPDLKALRTFFSNNVEQNPLVQIGKKNKYRDGLGSLQMERNVEALTEIVAQLIGMKYDGEDGIWKLPEEDK